MEIWTALVLGLVGSLHCLGMCGPLALALPATGTTRFSFALGRLAYNLGRITTYVALGAGFGIVGQSFALFGLQRWLSIGAGAAILLGLIASIRWAANAPMVRGIRWLKGAFATLLRRRSLGSLVLLGGLNGLLPCGLVYVACAGAAATGASSRGAAYMVAFGAGTLPVMLGVNLIVAKVQPSLRNRLQRFIPASAALLGLLLIVLGLSLGIPYLSPGISDGHQAHISCH